MGSQDRLLPPGAEELQSDRSPSSEQVLLELTVRGSRQQVLQGLRAWLELSLLTPEHFRLLVEQYRLEGRNQGQRQFSPATRSRLVLARPTCSGFWVCLASVACTVFIWAAGGRVCSGC